MWLLNKLSIVTFHVALVASALCCVCHVQQGNANMIVMCLSQTPFLLLNWLTCM